MTTLIIAATLALATLAQPAAATDVWTTIANEAPRASVDRLRDSARKAGSGDDGIVGELHPWVEHIGGPTR